MLKSYGIGFGLRKGNPVGECNKKVTILFKKYFRWCAKEGLQDSEWKRIGTLIRLSGQFNVIINGWKVV